MAFLEHDHPGGAGNGKYMKTGQLEPKYRLTLPARYEMISVRQ
jgi:hypothetical protein